jgi:hypothetical protein
VLVNQFTIERREFLMPVDDLRWSVSGRTHIDILPIYNAGNQGGGFVCALLRIVLRAWW